MKPLEIVAMQTQLSEVASAILDHFPHERIFGFYGEMGVGKTTFIKEICKILHVEQTITSPTFAILNEYLTIDDNPVYHFDFYRINNIEEAIATGFSDYLHSSHYCFIEWTEKIEDLLGNNFVKINICRVDDETRIFSISPPFADFDNATKNN